MPRWCYRSDHPRLEPTEQFQQLIAADLALQHRSAVLIDAMDPKDVLRDIQTDGANLHGDGSSAVFLVGMEACATAHHWARELGALGHEVRLMPPACVKAYVKRNKNDAADAEVICEAVTRPTMRFVPIKSTEAQSVLMLHRRLKG